MLGCVEKAILTGDSTRPRACIGADTHAMCAARETVPAACATRETAKKGKREESSTHINARTLRLSVVSRRCGCPWSSGLRLQSGNRTYKLRQTVRCATAHITAHTSTNYQPITNKPFGRHSGAMGR